MKDVYIVTTLLPELSLKHGLLWLPCSCKTGVAQII